MSDDVVNERRMHVRFTLNAEAKLKMETGEIFDGYLNDLSIGGVFMLLETALTEDYLNKEGEIQIHCDNNETVEAVCKIVRIQDNGLGIFFQDMDADNKKNLHRITTRLRDLMKQEK